MVKIINSGAKPLIRRLGTGANITFYPNQEVEVKDEALIAQIKNRKRVGDLQIKDTVGKEDVGGGIKTGVKPANRRGRPAKSKVSEKVDKLKDPKKKDPKPKKGLAKAKKGKAD
tara:strand:+ start:47 stop:388 length:342 start_codon:yes stop_codon:yes gene_type:complete